MRMTSGAALEGRHAREAVIENPHSALATRSVVFFREKFRKVIADSPRRASGPDDERAIGGHPLGVPATSYVVAWW
jgi:hypothetical protein